MTCLPEVIGPVFPSPEGDKLEGLFSLIKTYNADPISANIVKLEGTALPGSSINNVVLWKGDYATGQYHNEFVISFPNHYIFPTNYTIEPPARTDWCYQEKWEVYGYNVGESEDHSKWTKLHEGESTDEILCGTGLFCVPKGISSFPLKTFNPPKSFQYIKFIATESTCANHFVTRGIDFYGYLTFQNYFPRQTKAQKCTNDLPSLLLKIHLLESYIFIII